MMTTYRWLANKWIQLSKGNLEGKVTLPIPYNADNSISDLNLSDNMQDAYHAGAVCKKTFDKFMLNVMKVVKPRVTR